MKLRFTPPMISALAVTVQFAPADHHGTKPTKTIVEIPALGIEAIESPERVIRSRGTLAIRGGKAASTKGYCHNCRQNDSALKWHPDPKRREAA